MYLKNTYFIVLIAFLCQAHVFAKDYFVHPKLGNDTYSGESKQKAFRTLEKASTINYLPGDCLLLASGETFTKGLELKHCNGSKNNPIRITSYSWDSNPTVVPATINFKGYATGILIEDSSFIEVSNIQLTADGYYDDLKAPSNMTCGVLITNSTSNKMQNISLDRLSIYDVFYEAKGFTRGKDEVKTANGTQKYGWGIRVINQNDKTLIDDVIIENCSIKSVSHTGIKLTGSKKNITNITIKNNSIERPGGPGIQMSHVKDVHVSNNHVTHSGSDDDTRKWGRGSGLWTWSASNVLIENNKFLYANGPGDSAGAHIDFNCDNIILQYNVSAYNSGGFCEILGNNYNCAYRYNISINDGHRIKGVDGAFQEGKLFWLSGYQGQEKKRKGPVNSYFYNNTMYSDATIVSKIAIDNTSKGILIANNIFYLKGGAKAVLGDQYKPDSQSGDLAEDVVFKNNLFLNSESWPKDIGLFDSDPIFGNPKFSDAGGLNAADYIPTQLDLIKDKGITIELLPNDTASSLQPLNLKKDILGNTVTRKPSIGAIAPQ